MSHFTGLVILTPEFIKNHFEPLEEALEEYDENLEVPEHSTGLVSNYDKCFFLRHSNEDIVDEKFEYRIYRRLYRRGKILPFYKQNDWTNRYQYIRCMANQDKEYFVRCFLIEYPELFENFEKEYEEKGDEWNGGRWRINPENGKWEEYSTYNPNSKWDWYDEHGRWRGLIKTLDGDSVDYALLEEVDWEKTNTPFCVVIDGTWYEKGEMGWWAMVSNEIPDDEWDKKFLELVKGLPEDSEVYNIDFHI